MLCRLILGHAASPRVADRLIASRGERQCTCKRATRVVESYGGANGRSIVDPPVRDQADYSMTYGSGTGAPSKMMPRTSATQP